jgi:UDP-N-acetylmuramate dehydrogenase
VNAVQENLMLSSWTTFGVGGPARYFLNATAEQDVPDGLDFAKSKRLPECVLGGGSNLLVADSGFDGLVLKVGLKGLQWEDAQLRASAGEDWDSVVASCVGRGLGGVECLSGIPGLAGGTPVQNVGAYGQGDLRCADWCARWIVDRIHRRTIEAGLRLFLSRDIFTAPKGRYIVLSVTYHLRKHSEPPA